MCVQFCLSVAELGRVSEKIGEESDAVSRVGLNGNNSLINDLAEQVDAVDVSTEAGGDVAVKILDNSEGEDENDDDVTGGTDLSETENLAFQLEGAKAAALKGLNDRSGKPAELLDCNHTPTIMPCHTISDLLGVPLHLPPFN